MASRRQGVTDLAGDSRFRHPAQDFLIGAIAGGPAAIGRPGDGHRRLALQERGQVLDRSEEQTSELQSLAYLVCRLLLEKKKIMAKPLGQTVIETYVVAVMAIGPFTPGPTFDAHTLQLLTQLSVAFFMFSVPAHVSLHHM